MSATTQTRQREDRALRERAAPNYRFALPRDGQTAAYGRPIPIVYGTQRVAGNIVLSGWYMENKVTGKGGYGSWPAGLVQIALCEGPISEVLGLWVGQDRHTLVGFGLDLVIGGARSQGPWSYLTTNYPNFALGYGGTALLCESTAWPAKADGAMAQGSAEVSGLFTSATGLQQTVHPATIIADLLTNAEYGLGWPTSRIAGYDISTGTPVAFTAGIDGTEETSFYNLCIAGGFGLAILLDDQRPAREVLEEIARATDSAFLWSEGKLTLRPLAGWSHSVWVTYDGAAAIVPVYDLGAVDRDFLADEGEDPITIERTPYRDTFNVAPVEWTNRQPARVNLAGAALPEPVNAYNEEVAEGTADPGDVLARGVVRADPISLRCIVQQAHASYVANILAARSLGQRNRYRFRLGWRCGLLEPGDVVTITEPMLGLDHHLVRLLEIEEDESGTLDVVAEDISKATGVAGLRPLVAWMSDVTVYGFCSAAPCTAVSATATGSAAGGSGTYTYAWTRVSGDTFTINSPTSATTTFTKTSALGTYTGVYRCTVTDTVTGASAYADVNVELEGGA